MLYLKVKEHHRVSKAQLERSDRLFAVGLAILGIAAVMQMCHIWTDSQ